MKKSRKNCEHCRHPQSHIYQIHVYACIVCKIEQKTTIETIIFQPYENNSVYYTLAKFNTIQTVNKYVFRWLTCRRIAYKKQSARVILF